jgi:hypothetical protein
VSEFVLTHAEKSLLEALDGLGVRYLVVGMAAALLEGAAGTTQDLDLWFGSIDPARVGEAARRAGGFYTSGLGMQPPAIGGGASTAWMQWLRRKAGTPSRASTPGPRSTTSMASGFACYLWPE